MAVIPFSLWHRLSQPVIPLGLAQSRIDAGGYVINISTNWSTGDVYCGVDTVGAYRLVDRSTNRWEQLVTIASMGGYTEPGACLGIVASKSNPNIVFAWLKVTSTRFYLHRSSNKGTTWTNTGLYQDFGGDLPEMNRGAMGTIAIDPANPDCVYASCWSNSSPHNSLHYTKVGTTATTISDWSKITAVPDGINNGPANAGMCFDEVGGTVVVGGQTRTKNFIVPSFGNGIWRSTDGGGSEGSFTQIADGAGGNSPTQIMNGDQFQTGTYAQWYYCGNVTSAFASAAASQVWRYHPTLMPNWERVTVPPGAGMYFTPQAGQVSDNIPSQGIALNHNRSGDIIFTGNAMFTARTIDNCASFITNTGGGAGNWIMVTTQAFDLDPTESANNVTWLKYAFPVASTGGESGGAVQDPLNSGRVISATGVGVFYMQWSDTWAMRHWNVWSLGIQQLECDDVIRPPGSPYSEIFACRDRGIISPGSGNAVATTYQPQGGFGHAYNVDYAASDPSFVLAIYSEVFGAGSQLAKSTNYGLPGSFSTVAAWNAAIGVKSFGNVAPMTPLKWIALAGSTGGNAGTLKYTGDGGATFDDSTGIDNTHWPNNSFTQSRLLTRDLVNFNKCYAYVPTIGIYGSTTSGQSFSAMAGGPVSGPNTAAALRAVPNNEGHLILNNPNSGTTESHPLYLSPDGGDTLIAAPGMAKVWILGNLGATKNGASYPRVLVIAIKDGETTLGLHYCDDFNVVAAAGTPTWVTITNDLPTYLGISSYLRACAVDGSDANIFYFASGHPGNGGWRLRIA